MSMAMAWPIWSTSTTAVTLWVNRSGAGWSDPVNDRGDPVRPDAGAVRIVDLLGSGIGGLLYTADAVNGRPRANIHFLDLTGAAKPYLLNRMDNHLGAVTIVGYRPSTVDYLRTRRPKNPLAHSPALPRPGRRHGRGYRRHLRGKRTTEYRYHHGYWDGGEREFRGFGMVEQLDSEDFETYKRSASTGTDRPSRRPEPSASPADADQDLVPPRPGRRRFGEWESWRLG